MARVSLLFGLHCHQPEGNFDEVIADACDRSYLPFLEIAEEFPDFHFAIHFSGSLLAWIERERPHLVEIVRRMAARGQVELVGAGDYEPVLAAIPEADRIGQIEALSRRIETLFGVTPRGAWLTERVWDATVVPALAATGMEYAMVDDYHFFCAGFEAADLGGHYRTEESDHAIDVFPISEALRYRLPFSPADDVVRFIEGHADGDGEFAAVCFDDGEKFGVWPETFEWVYERRWLRDFLAGVCDSDIIEPLTFGEYRSRHRHKGTCYLPTASYIEMGEWALQPEAARRFERLLQRERAAGDFEAHKPFLRGGIWKNFLVKYPESAWMHKRMLALSRRLRGLGPDHPRAGEMRDLLYRAQANDAYWHGMFGGIYHPHLRRSVYRNLVALESMLDAIDPRPRIAVRDVDMDGADEYLLHGEAQQVIVQPHAGGIIREWDLYAPRHNLADVVRRHREAYHDQAAEGATREGSGEGIASIHDRVAFRCEIAPEDLEPDEAPRAIACDHVTLDDAPQPVDAPCEAHIGDGCVRLVRRMEGVTLTKEISLPEPDTLRVDYRIDAERDAALSLASVWNVAVPSCDGPAGSYRLGKEVLGGFDGMHRLEENDGIRLHDALLGCELRLGWSQAARLELAPLRTVCRSESGFEKVMQAAAVTPAWRVRLPAGGDWHCAIRTTIVSL